MRWRISAEGTLLALNKTMEIIINKITFKVQFVDGNNVKMNPEPDCYLGLTEFLELTINIRKGLSGVVSRATVIHELTHAFIYAFGYHLENEESFCDFMGAQADEIMKLADQITEEAAKENV